MNIQVTDITGSQHKDGAETETTLATKSVEFAQLPISAPLQKALAGSGYTEATPIQAAAIPVLHEGHDLLACAQTGTGKTAAFALPTLDYLQAEPRKLNRGEARTVVLAPTRELAIQVAESFEKYAQHLGGIRVALVYGGVSQKPQERALSKGVEVLVGTPGRLMDLCQQGVLDLSNVDVFILDEADRMLDMGFIDDIRKIAGMLPPDRQTLLFSATMPPAIAKLAADLLHEPKEIRIAPAATTAKNVSQQVCFVDAYQKNNLLIDLITETQETSPGTLTIVFTRTKSGANRVTEQIKRAGIKADAIHGDKTQAARQRTLEKFKEGKIPVLVATDVASRGIDVKNISLVVNYNLPVESDAYVHRIGRTARAGASGRAVSLCTSEDISDLRIIERLIRESIPVNDTHAYHDAHLAERYAAGAGSGGGKRGGKPNRGSVRRGSKRGYGPKSGFKAQGNKPSFKKGGGQKKQTQGKAAKQGGGAERSGKPSRNFRGMGSKPGGKASAGKR